MGVEFAGKGKHQIEKDRDCDKEGHYTEDNLRVNSKIKKQTLCCTFTGFTLSIFGKCQIQNFKVENNEVWTFYESLCFKTQWHFQEEIKPFNLKDEYIYENGKGLFFFHDYKDYNEVLQKY